MFYSPTLLVTDSSIEHVGLQAHPLTVNPPTPPPRPQLPTPPPRPTPPPHPHPQLSPAANHAQGLLHSLSVGEGGTGIWLSLISD